MKTQAMARIFQFGVKFSVLGFATYLAVMHQLQGVLAVPNAHVYCPFGGLESLYQWAAGGGYLKKIMPATMILTASSLLLVLVWNRAFCGWICPLGTLQTIFDKLARLLHIKKIQVPAAIEKPLSLIKYALLVVILFFTWRAGDLVYGYYDPWAAYAHLAAGFAEVYAEFLIGAIFLLIALLGSFWLPNNFCRYFCPMGAVLGIFAKISPTRIARNASTCINCKKCDQVCPAQLQISTQPRVTSAECLTCGDCVAACPVPNTLNVRIGGKKALHWGVYGLGALLLFFTPVGIAKQAGWWKTNFGSAQEVLIDNAGALNPDNIKGSMTLESVLTEFKMPKEVFLEKFQLPAETVAIEMLKNIAQANGLEVEDFRAFIKAYLQEKHPENSGEAHE